MHITPEIVEQAYEFLRATPPFRGWKLPSSDDVEFHVKHIKSDRYADFYHAYDRGKPRGKWTMRVDPRGCTHTDTLLRTLAHEMVHLREATMGLRLDVKQGASFKRLSAQVCRTHGFDPGVF